MTKSIRRRHERPIRQQNVRELLPELELLGVYQGNQIEKIIAASVDWRCREQDQVLRCWAEQSAQFRGRGFFVSEVVRLIDHGEVEQGRVFELP